MPYCDYCRIYLLIPAYLLVITDVFTCDYRRIYKHGAKNKQIPAKVLTDTAQSINSFGAIIPFPSVLLPNSIINLQYE